MDRIWRESSRHFGLCAMVLFRAAILCRVKRGKGVEGKGMLEKEIWKKEPWERERQAFLRRERQLILRCSRQGEPFLEKKLRRVVPEGLREKLEAAFFQTFRVILENGSQAIERTIPKERLRSEYQTREYAAELYPVRKNLAAGRRAAERQRATGVAGACAEGAALGILGIGLPDIPLFLALLWRSLYTLCLQYGVDYEKTEEKEFLLDLLIQSLYRGEDFRERDAAVNRRIYERESAAGQKKEGGREGTVGQKKAGGRESAISQEKLRAASGALAGELLYLKFLQGIPLVGAVGGIYNGIYMKRVTDYVAIKLERRHLLRRGEL